MTTIAYRDGVMAADSGTVFGGSMILHHNTHKVVRHETATHIYLGGCAGLATICAGFRQWMRDGMKDFPPLKVSGEDTGSAIMAIFDKATSEVELWQYEVDGGYVVDEPYAVEGSGSGYAMAVLWNGGTAVEAIKAAIYVDTLTNGRVQTVKFGPAYDGPLAPFDLLPKRKRHKESKGVNSELGTIRQIGHNLATKRALKRAKSPSKGAQRHDTRNPRRA